MSEIFCINSGPLKRFFKPVRDALYLRFLKRFPCVVCGSCKMMDPAHFGPHGTGTKASDVDALPLCRTCHEAYHKSARTFAEAHGLDVPELQAFFRHMYFLKTGKRLGEEERAS